jgi:hypothetical protein
MPLVAARRGGGVTAKDDPVKTILTAAAALMLTATAACGAPPSNLLIGSWKLDPAAAPSPYCIGPLSFTAGTVTRPDAQGQPSTVAVTYVTSQTASFPTVVFMMTDAGAANHDTYRFSSRDRMILDAQAQCAYVRA